MLKLYHGSNVVIEKNRFMNKDILAIKEKNGNTFTHELFKVGDLVTFLCGDTLKEGVVLIVDAHGTFESPNTPSYDIMVENENMLYKHVKCDLVKSKI